MKQIARNKYYELSYDEGNNIVFWIMYGAWDSMAVAPSFQTDWNQAVNAASKPFKAVFDISLLVYMSDDVKNANNHIVDQLLLNGLEKAAYIVGKLIDKVRANEQASAQGDSRVFQAFTFQEKKEAVEWLLGE